MNLTDTAGNRLFGLDLSRWPGQWRAAGALLLEWPLLQRLVPQAAVELRRADGQATHWQMARGVATPTSTATPGPVAHALQLSAARVLERQLTLPPLADTDREQAVRLDVASSSPFSPEQTIYGHVVRDTAAGVTRLAVAITSRQQIEQALRESGFNPAQPPEVWVLPQAGDGQPVRPIVLRGFGESAREQRVRRGLQQRLALLALVLALLAALLVTPTALMRARAAQARQAFAALQQQAAPQLAQREALMKQLERLQVASHLLDEQLAMSPVLDMLTRTLPDGAWLTGLRAEGAKLVLNGQADDAAALVQRLAGQPGVHDVRLASPATRGAGAAKETFIIELRLDARRYGPVQGGEGASS